MDRSARSAQRHGLTFRLPFHAALFLLAALTAVTAFDPARALPSAYPANSTQKTTAAAAQTVTLLRGPYLQVPTTDGMTIVWATKESGAPAVKFGLDWTASGFDDSKWPTGRAGFGYGAGKNSTTLSDMRGGYTSVFLRKTFALEEPKSVEKMVLSVSYSGGFVAYLNGEEVASSNIDSYHPDESTRADKAHDAARTQDFDISAFRTLLVRGENVLAISGHNVSLTNEDFSITPVLKLATTCAQDATASSDVWRYFKGASYPEDLTEEKKGESAFSSALDGYYQHQVTLAGLRPGTRYDYRAYLNGMDVANDRELTFRTSATPANPYVSILAFGDSGDGSAAQARLRDQMLKESFDLAIPVGDIAYPDGRYIELQDYYFNVYKSMMGVTPFVPVSGNHEYHQTAAAPFYALSVLPENGPEGNKERYFSFDYGNVHFIGLDSEQINGAQRDWLRDDLAANKQPWVIVYLHRSLFGEDSSHSISESATLRKTFAPVFEEFHVDLVIAGHNHMYGRSVPLKDAQPGKPYGVATTVTDGGVVYITTGSGGGKLNPVYKDDFFQPPGATFSATEYTKVVVNDCALSLQAIDLNGTVRDSYAIDHCGAASEKNNGSGSSLLSTSPCLTLTATPTATHTPVPAHTASPTPGHTPAAAPAPTATAAPTLSNPAVTTCTRVDAASRAAFDYSFTIFSVRRSVLIASSPARFTAQGLWTRTSALWPLSNSPGDPQSDSPCVPPGLKTLLDQSVQVRNAHR